MKTLLNSFLFLQIFYIRHVSSTMPVSCLTPLNTSDCHATPTRVFSYYKSGSRCELEVWRGCPTGNKFDTEEECSEHCIFKDVDFGNKPKHVLDAKCISKEDLNNCNDKIIHGFKYDNLKIDCVEVATNCPGNIFEEKLECIQSCVRDLTWLEKIKLISAQQSKELEEILKKFANETIHDDDSKTTTDSGELKTTHMGKTDVNGTNTTGITDAGDKKLHGGGSTTESHENKGTGGNSTSTGNGTGSAGTDVTKVSIDHNSNTTSNNSNNTKETTNQHIITSVNVGTPTKA